MTAFVLLGQDYRLTRAGMQNDVVRPFLTKRNR